MSTSNISATGTITANNYIYTSSDSYAAGFRLVSNSSSGMFWNGSGPSLVAQGFPTLQVGYGLVGINGGPSSLGALRIHSGGFNGAYSISYGYLNPSGNTGFTSGSSNYYSIWADQRIVCSEFNAYSDARIKKVIGVSDNNTDLANLMKLKITDYSFVDTIANGNRKEKKVIAQEVEQIYPSAISKTTNVVPDIMKKAPLKEGWIHLVTDLKVGERIRIVAEGRGNEVFDVTEVKKDKFRASFDGKGKDKDGKDKEVNEVFIYGREVKDFRVVDYDALGMLNISATQQVKKDSDTAEEALRKENEALRKESEALRAKVTEMEKKIASTVQASTATEARLAALEKALSKEAKPAARTASIKAGE